MFKLEKMKYQIENLDILSDFPENLIENMSVLKISSAVLNAEFLDICFKGLYYETHVQLPRSIPKKEWQKVMDSVKNLKVYAQEFEYGLSGLCEIGCTEKEGCGYWEFNITNQPEDFNGINIDITINLDSHHDKGQLLNALGSILHHY